MKITEEQFNNNMELNDKLNTLQEDLGGAINAIMDGENEQQFEHTPEEMDIMIDRAFKSQQTIAKTLGVKVEALDSILSSSTVNRWEVYLHIKGEL